jgi:hypothetical protein
MVQVLNNCTDRPARKHKQAMTLQAAAQKPCGLGMSAAACWKRSEQEMTTDDMQYHFGVLVVL